MLLWRGALTLTFALELVSEFRLPEDGAADSSAVSDVVEAL